MDELVQVSFLIISQAGFARSKYIEAYKRAKEGNFEVADTLLKEGDEYFLNAHKEHAIVIQKEANGDNILPSVLLMHSEDQLMTAETTKLLAVEVIELHKKVNQLIEKVERLEEQ